MLRDLLLCAELFFAPAIHQSLIHVARENTDAVFVPIGAGFPSTVPDSRWEFTLRSLSNASANWLVSKVSGLLSARCTCFEQLVAATHAVSLGRQAATATARAAIAAFRRSTTVHARALLNLATIAPRAAQDMLFVVRRGTRRIIVNEEELLKTLLNAQPRLRVVAFEDIPIAQQVAMVSEASVLIGVHGMAIAGYVAHLPADRRRTACVEIQPQPDAHSWEWVTIVPRIAAAAGIYHQAIVVPHAPGCYIDQVRARNCTADANPELCFLRARKAMRSFQATSVLNCNVTVDSKGLLPLISKADAHTRADAERRR